MLSWDVGELSMGEVPGGEFGISLGECPGFVWGHFLGCYGGIWENCPWWVFRYPPGITSLYEQQL